MLSASRSSMNPMYFLPNYIESAGKLVWAFKVLGSKIAVQKAVMARVLILSPLADDQFITGMTVRGFKFLEDAVEVVLGL